MDILRTIMAPASASARTQLFEFSLYDGIVAVMLGPISFWLQLFMMLAMQSFVSALFAIFIYEFIVKQRKLSPSSTTTGILTNKYLLGFGVVIPTAVMLPFYFIEYFRIVNISIMVGASALAIIVPYNCMEAIFDTSETGVESNLSRYISYYSTIVPLQRDPQTGAPIPITRKELLKEAITLAYHLVLIVLYLMVVIHFNFVFFPSSREPNKLLPSNSLLGLLHWGHILNNFVTAAFMGQCLEAGPRGVGLVVSIITGSKVIVVMRNPIFASQSPSDFWGRRWNLMLHGSFKRGVFKPLVALYRVPRPVAMMATFVLSGIMHEYVCCLVQSKCRLYPEIASPYEPYFGRQLAFFVWNGLVVLLEYAISAMLPFQWIKRNLPGPVITALVLLTVLPVSHWFTDEYIRSGFYSDYSMGFPLILYVKAP